MAISYLGKGSLPSATGVPTPPTWPAHQAGDLGVLLVETANQPISAPSGWTQVGSNGGQGTPGAAGATCTQVFWRIAESASEAGPTLPDAGDHTIAQVLAWRGVHPDTPLDSTPAQGTASGTDLTLTGVTRATSGALAVVVVSSALDASTLGLEFDWAPERGLDMVERQDVTRLQGVGGGFGIAEQPAADPGGTGATGSFYCFKTTSETVDYTVFALRPAAVEAKAAGTSASGSLGSASASADALSSPAGVAGTAALGGATTSAEALASPAGLLATGASGTATVTALGRPTPLGVAASAALGAVAPEADALAGPAGVAASTALGEVAALVWVEATPAGVSASTALGEVVAGGVRDATAYPAGVSTGGAGVCEAPPLSGGGVRVVREVVTRLSASVTPLGVGARGAVGAPMFRTVGTVSVPTRTDPAPNRVGTPGGITAVPTLPPSQAAVVVPLLPGARGALGAVAATGEDWLADDELALILSEIAA